MRSVIFFLRPSHGQTLTRLADVPFAIAAIIAFYVLVRLWYGKRVAFFSGLLFATSAWTLHVGRLASNDVMYLWASTWLLLSLVLVRKFFDQPLVFLGSLFIWLLLLYIPGMVWLVLLTVIVQWSFISDGWLELSTRLRALAGLLVVVMLPLLGIALRRPGEWQAWLGLPAHFATPAHLLKQFGAVIVHLFVRGPQYPQLWLGRAPLLDVFSLAMCLIGIYFLARHFSAFRSRLLIAYFLIGAILLALGGPVGLSTLVPLLYVFLATGIAYLSHEWLRTFPVNPLARGVGLGLLSLAIAISCLYNLRAYFVAWPHNATTKATFRYHR